MWEGATAEGAFAVTKNLALTSPNSENSASFSMVRLTCPLMATREGLFSWVLLRGTHFTPRTGLNKRGYQRLHLYLWVLEWWACRTCLWLPCLLYWHYGPILLPCGNVVGMSFIFGGWGKYSCRQLQNPPRWWTVLDGLGVRAS